MEKTSRQRFVDSETMKIGVVAPLLAEQKPEKLPRLGFNSHGNDRLAPPTPKPRGDRNAPCACGSTKKFKKCCGAAPKYDAPPVAEQPQAA